MSVHPNHLANGDVSLSALFSVHMTNNVCPYWNIPQPKSCCSVINSDNCFNASLHIDNCVFNLEYLVTSIYLIFILLLSMQSTYSV